MSARADLHPGILEDVLVPLRVRACYGQQQQLGPLKHEPNRTGNELPAFSPCHSEFDLLLLRQTRFETASSHVGPLIETV